MMAGIAFAHPGESGEGRSVHLPCGHDAVVPEGSSVMMLPTAVLEHLDHCDPDLESLPESA
ncbi:MAG TPA: hypothetical protein VMH90_02940 [Thermoplasmata archaeon]|nr:hypothetical protein [Thermoplasmata archaeon]